VGRKQSVVINGTKSSLTDVKSGIPQGSVLGPLLFVVFINDMSSSVTSKCKLFADDSKIYGPVDTEEGIQTIQKDLNQLVGWSDKWQMGHNVDKCKSLHLGNQNPGHQYVMNGNPLTKTSAEKDLGVMVDEDLKFHVHTAKVVSKAFQILAVVNKSFVNLDAFTLPLLYKTLVRPHLEYGNVIWGPHSKLDQKAVERVQRRATKMVPTLKDLPYESRLEQLNIPTLYYRRKRGDMIQVYKIMKGIDRISADIFFKRAPCPSTRGHSLKLAKPTVMKTPRSHSFSVRIVNDWNSLPEAAVNAESVNVFKNEVDRYWRREKCLFSPRKNGVV
jgi:ribonuclease P/MRP protein subunit RPP40